MWSAARSSDHHWEGIVAKDNARLHSGHVYNHTENVHYYAPDRNDSPEARDRAERAWGDALLNWLTFAEINDRREQVKIAHQETFRWMFDERSATGFVEWLRSGDGIYWVRGKPASGKSTLMKFIAGEPRFQELLREWTGNTSIVISSFWFWAAGSPLQRSLNGLYRSLLVQMLRTNSRLYRCAFPEWKQEYSRMEPTMGMLSTAMSNLLASKALSTNFFFIIDGLDEYEGQSVDKAEVAELVFNMTKSSRVRCLVSSRPETPFMIAFRRAPQIRLESLTKRDIFAYVQTKLQDNPRLRDISAIERRNIDDIGNFIVEHADGVFLWVYLVTKIALDGINSYEDPSMIRDRIMDLPQELDDMFTHVMTKRIAIHHRHEAYRYLSVALRFESQELNVKMNHFLLRAAQQASDYQSACELVSLRHEGLFISKFSQNSERIADRGSFAALLANRCHGLLEVHNKDILDWDSRITFCHRTLFDYLNEREEAKRLLASAVGESFDVDTAIMVGIVHQAWSFTGGQKKNRHALDLRKCFYFYNVRVEDHTGQHRSELIEALDRWKPETLVFKSSKSTKVMHTHPRIDLLSQAAHTGSALYLERAIQRHGANSAEDLTLMLYSACEGLGSGWNFDSQFQDVQRDLHPHRLKACQILLMQGADPALQYPQSCAWSLVLAMLCRVEQGPRSVQENTYEADFTLCLRLLLMLAQYAPDVRRCRGLTAEGSGEDFWHVRQMLKEKACCSFPLWRCPCEEAQTHRNLIRETSYLLYASETASGAGAVLRSESASYFEAAADPEAAPRFASTSRSKPAPRSEAALRSELILRGITRPSVFARTKRWVRGLFGVS